MDRRAGGRRVGGGNLAARVTDLEAGQATLLSAVSNIQIDINTLLSVVSDLQDAVEELQGGGGVSVSDDPVKWEGTHTWQTDTGPGSGKTIKTFSVDLPSGAGLTTVLSIPVPNNSGLFLNTWASGALLPPISGGFGMTRAAATVNNLGGTLTLGEEDIAPDEGGDQGIDLSYGVSGTNLDLQIDNGGAPIRITGWVEYTSVSFP